ncbi:phosphatidylserine decarboxylase [Luedemannella helvata]|uniref:Phosphatidylserine decarboxylase n=1 Tax=Luedemannella helvata TaxID=349315 RepID=A0ABN2JQ81_9ACTN
MTESPSAGLPGPGFSRVEGRAAAALAADFARRTGSATGLVVGVSGQSEVLNAAIEALGPAGTLTVVAGAASAEVRAHVTAASALVEQRVRVIETLADADPADSVIIAEPLKGSAESARAEIDGLAKLLTPGGVLSVAVPAAEFLAGPAAAEVARYADSHGVGSDLVLINPPPLKVQRLCFSAAEPALAESLAPLARTSSVKLSRTMNIDSNGVAAAAIFLGAAALLRTVRPRSRAWLVPALAAGPVAAFFRDPERQVPTDPSAVVAASDGRVLSVERLRDDKLGTWGEREYLRVAVFLSVLDVHVNRAPVAGRVADQFVVDGGFAAAMKPEAEHNVAAYTVLETTRGPVVVAQRTGLIARRIVHRAPAGSLLARGERFGLIRFGSRTDVYLPADLAVAEVAVGDRVVGGETVIARWI